jgi:hypothetical protein
MKNSPNKKGYLSWMRYSDPMQRLPSFSKGRAGRKSPRRSARKYVINRPGIAELVASAPMFSTTTATSMSGRSTPKARYYTQLYRNVR